MSKIKELCKDAVEHSGVFAWHVDPTTKARIQKLSNICIKLEESLKNECSCGIIGIGMVQCNSCNTLKEIEEEL